ncbi:hypothetical protein [Paenibacillus sp. VTT E-133291]|uniref:hypothetical protein n=1 Tax=Paenibacillus sp. VTT E-133291 TaxID=1986223 RepID=UPI000B9FC98D|nr:hypothetical protein [Paenibacillus sp. VTT E-133291]OZQ97433.1 hypothetical protein CA598_06455 [Paenibacillus sp. VTT E-133291]
MSTKERLILNATAHDFANQVAGNLEELRRNQQLFKESRMLSQLGSTNKNLALWNEAYSQYKELGPFAYYHSIQDNHAIGMRQFESDLAIRIGSIGYRRISEFTESTWFNEDNSLFGGRGFDLLLPDGNRVYMDAEVENKCLYISQIKVKEKGIGLGNRVMELVKDLVLNSEYIQRVEVYKVTNHAFFRKFQWLKEKEFGDFISSTNQTAHSNLIV